MNCPEVRERISAFLDDALGPEESADLGDHLEGCEACREALDGLEATVALIREVPEPEVPPDFVEEVVIRLPRPSPRLRLVHFVPLAAAAVLLFVVAIDLSSRTRTPAAPEHTEVADSPALEPASGSLSERAPAKESDRAGYEQEPGGLVTAEERTGRGLEKRSDRSEPPVPVSAPRSESAEKDATAATADTDGTGAGDGEGAGDDGGAGDGGKADDGWEAGDRRNASDGRDAGDRRDAGGGGGVGVGGGAAPAGDPTRAEAAGRRSRVPGRAGEPTAGKFEEGARDRPPVDQGSPPAPARPAPAGGLPAPLDTGSGDLPAEPPADAPDAGGSGLGVSGSGPAAPDRRYLLAGVDPDSAAGLLLAELHARRARKACGKQGSVGEGLHELVQPGNSGEPERLLLSLTIAELEYVKKIVERMRGAILERVNGHRRSQPDSPFAKGKDESRADQEAPRRLRVEVRLSR